MKHLMIDIETCALGHDAVVWSVGIHGFRLDRMDVVPEAPRDFFYLEPREQANQWDRDLTRTTQETIEWTFSNGDVENFVPWYEVFNESTIREVSDERAALPTDTLTILDLHTYLKFICDAEPTLVWCKGKEFDITILKYQFGINGLREPWHYRNAMCMRTLDGLLRTWGHETLRAEPSHNAIQDCAAQIELMGRQMKLLYGTMQLMDVSKNSEAWVK